MPKNRYFDFSTNIPEQALLSSLKKEAIEIYGVNVYYVKRNSVDYNNILGEDLKQSFTDATMLVMYPENIEGYGSNKEMLSKFGFSLQDTLNWVVHKDEFSLVLNQQYPQAGDLIYWDTVKRLFSITFVDIDYEFNQLGKNYVYQIQSETFKYSSETIDTDIPSLDIFEEFKNNGVDVTTDPNDVNNADLQTKATSIIVNE